MLTQHLGQLEHQGCPKHPPGRLSSQKKNKPLSSKISPSLVRGSSACRAVGAGGGGRMEQRCSEGQGGRDTEENSGSPFLHCKEHGPEFGAWEEGPVGPPRLWGRGGMEARMQE